MKVVLRTPEREEHKLNGPKRVREVLTELGVNPEGVIVARGEELLTLDDEVADEDTIEVISAVSGGRA
jgi:sulfur carrier protein